MSKTIIVDEEEEDEDIDELGFVGGIEREAFTEFEKPNEDEGGDGDEQQVGKYGDRKCVYLVAARHLWSTEANSTASDKWNQKWMFLVEEKRMYK